MLAVSRHLMKRVDSANRARNNLVHAYHSVSPNEKNSTTFRFSRREGYHNQTVSVVSEKQLNEYCDELFELRVIVFRIFYLATYRPLRAYGNFGIKGRKIYAREFGASSEMFPGLERNWLPKQ